jgi:YD repeat-containing protein
MVAVVSGSGVGLLNSSLGLLGQGRLAERWQHGAAGESGFVNIANGNLVLQRRDDFLAAPGVDLKMVRTYNSQGEFAEGSGRQWKIGLKKQVGSLVGSVNAAGSTVLRLDGDGSLTQFDYDSSSGRYLNKNGSQSLELDGQKWTWRDQSGNGYYETYDQANDGRVLAAGDSGGERLHYEYRDDGLVSSIRTASGDVTFFEYDTNGNLSQYRTVAADSGKEQVRVHYGYDDLERLTSVTTDLSPEDSSTADGNTYVIQYGYDGESSRVASVEQSDGTRVEMTYQQSGGTWKVTSITDAQGTISIEYQQGRTVLTDGAGVVTAYGYDEAGRLLSVAGPGGVAQASFAYDAQGNMVRAALADGTAQDYEYDTRGQRVAVRGADGMLIEQRGFAPDGRLLAEISYDASFQASLTNYVYDSARRLAFVVAPDGQVQEYQYDSAGQRIATLRYPDVRYSGASRTEAELRAWAAKATPQRTSFTYDVRGLVASQTDGAGTTSFVHDQAGQLLQVIAPDGSTTQYTYDGLGRVQATVRTDGQMNISDVDQASTVMVTSFKDGQVSSSVSSGSEMMFASEPMAMAASEPVYDATITGTADGETLNGTAGNDLIEGAGGDDSLYGGSGNDMIDGGEGGDQIWGGDGSDTIKGGLGASGTDDSLRGEAGADTYIYELGSGKDWIYGQREEDTLQLGVGIDPNDVTFERYGSNLELVIRPNGGDEVGRIVLVNQVYDGTTADSGIKQIVYADGTVWDAAFIRARAVSGSGANDILRGTEGNDSVLGNGGSDTIYGGGGDDTLDGGTEADRLYGEAGNDSLRGAAGSDTIDGGDGNDYLDGGADGDELFGGNGNDTLTGGQGASGSDDRLFGGAGADTYVYELGGGKDWIAAQRDEDTLKLGAGINPADVGFERNGDNLELVIRQGGAEVGRLVLINQALDGTASETGVMQIVYADGTVWDAARIRAQALLGTNGSDVNLRGYSGDDTIAGNGGDDSLYGGDGNDVLDGGQGIDQIWGGNGNDTIHGGVGPGSDDDRLWGEAGADTYIYELGDGKDTVFGQRNEDTLQLGVGISPADVSFERIDSNVEVVIRQAGAEVGRVVLWNQAYDGVSSESGVMRIVFADGSSIDAATIRARAVGGGSGNDELRGTEGNDTIPGRAGDDTIYGGAGNDILDGGADHDRLYGEAGNDTVLGNTGDDSIYGGIGDDSLDGGAGTDTIWGSDGNDTISGGLGGSYVDDALHGEGGADTFIYELGSGTDRVYGQRTEDILRFGSGISQSDISFSRSIWGSPGDLNVVIRQNEVEVGRVVLVNQANDNPDADSGVQKIVFADGSSWDAATIRARALIDTNASNSNLRGYNSDDVIEGNGGNDTLYGGSGNDTLNGGAGNDAIYGELGNDTFVYELGGGNDTVNGQRNEDILKLGAGINRGDVSFLRSNYNVDVVIRQNGSEVGRVVLVNQLYDATISTAGVLRVVFADGTSLDAAAIRSLALSDLAGNDPLTGTGANDSIRGGAGNDTLRGMDGNDSLEGDEGDDQLFGGNGADTLRGGSGSDSLSGEAGADTYLYELGDGNDTIYGQRAEDVLRLGVGISPEDVGVERNDVHLFLVVRQNGIEVGRIKLDWQVGSSYASGVMQVVFADGTVWDTVEMKRRSLIGTDVRDRIFGYDTDDLLTGNSGDDDLDGGLGNDTLTGDSGIDNLHGGAGNDLLLGGGDKDLIYGDDGNDVLEGGGGDDRMWAGAGNDKIRGGLGNDEMYGNAGLDRFVYELGDGNDWVTGQRGEDTLQLGFGINPADVSVLQSSSDLILVIRQAGTEAGRITLANFASDAYDSGVKQVVFADGTVWEAAKIRQLPLNGTEGDDNFHGYSTNDIIKGNGGNDRIYGREGDDFIDGGAGGDWLSGENGNDTLRGGTGNDTLYGDAGADTYLYELGDGNDAINGMRSEDTLQLGAGISPADVAIIRGYDRLDVVIRQGGIEVGRIELNGQSSDSGSIYTGVMQIVFADGTRWDSAMIRLLSLNGTEGNDSLTGYNSDDLIQGKGGADTLFGGDGNDSIFGEAGNDSLNGGNGNDMLDGGTGYDTVRGGAGNDTLSGGIGASSSDDLLYGEAGADTYIYELGSYKDWVYGQRNEDTLRLGVGIAPADVSFARNGDNLDLVIIQGGVEVGRVVLVNQASDQSTAESGVMQIVFADGTVWNAATIRARALIDSDGSNTNLGGYNSDDFIAGNGGNDVISDPNGSDTIDGGAGNDTITDKGPGNNLISGGSGHDSITYSTASDNTIDGGTGNDTVKVDKTVDNAHFNQVAGGRGNDRLEGSNAADSYLFNRGDGQDTISDYDLNDRKRLDRLVFGEGITQADLAISRVGVSNLSIRVSDLGNQTLDEIVIESWFETSGRYQLERIDFADGSSMSKEQVSAVANVRYGTEGNDPAPVLDSIEGDVFYGLGGNDTIIATAKGNDYIDGGSGNDSIVDNGGFSNVLLGGDGADTVVFWEGASNTVKGGTGNDLITVKRTDMSLGLSNVFEGGQGNDVIQSGNSSDTYVFNRGDGHDTVLDNSGSASVIDRLRFGPGITSDQLSFARLGNDLIVLIGGGNVPTGSDQVTIASWFAGAGYQIERFEFEDGSVILSDAMPALRSVTNGTGDAGDNIIFGTAGNDVITDNAGGNNNLQGLGYNDTINFSGGNNFAGGGIGDDLIQGNGSGSNVLSGGTGNDRMYVSGTSSDTYLYGRGDGMDTVKDGGGSDVVVFAAGITLAHLNVSRNGNNLVVRVVDALSATQNDQITFEDWFVGSSNVVEKFRFADGLEIAKEQIVAMLVPDAKAGGLGVENLDPAALVAGGVNAGNGNFVLQQQDTALASIGLDVGLTRTYNSQAQMGAATWGNWQISAGRSVRLDSTTNIAYRSNGDGSESKYVFDGTSYRSVDGQGAYDKLVYDSNLKKWTWTDGATGIVETYDGTKNGRLTTSRDTSGNTTTYNYTVAGALDSIVSASGEKIVLAYDTAGNVKSVRVDYTANGQAKSGTRVYYDYDAQRRLTMVRTDMTPDDNSIADGDVYWTMYSYDGDSGRIASIWQKDGSALRLTYQQDTTTGTWRVKTLTDAMGRVTSLTYGANGTNVVEDAAGHKVSYAYDASGKLDKVIDQTTLQVSDYEYDANGNVTSVTDAKGITNTFGYDAAGNQTLDEIAGVRKIERTFVKPGLVQTSTVTADGKSQTTRNVYDAQDRLRFQLSPEGRVTEWRYNAKGEQTSSIEYAGNIFSLSALAVNQAPTEAGMVSWIAGVNRSNTIRTDFTYDSRSLVKTATTFANIAADGSVIADGTESTKVFTYDHNGLLLQSIDTNNRQVSYSYDALGRLVATVDARPDVPVISTTLYDEAAQTRITTGIDGNSVTEVRNRNGQLLSTTRRSAVATGITRIFYDAAGRPVMTQDAAGVRSFVRYDAAGRKVADIDGDGSVVEYKYGQNGQVTHTIAYAKRVDTAALVGADGKPDLAKLAALAMPGRTGARHAWNIYDAVGRLVQAVDGQGNVTVTAYDGAGLVTSVVRHAETVTVAGLEENDVLEAFALKVDAKDSVSRFFYDKDGNRLGQLDGAGNLAEFVYDAAGQLKASIVYTQATEPALRANGSLDDLRAAVAGSAAATNYLYNGKGQQVGSVDAMGTLTETVYDKEGNVSRKVRYGTTVAWQDGATLATLRPTAPGADRSWNYTYTKLNQLETETAPDQTVTRYRYDKLGKVTSVEHFVGTAVAVTSLARYDVEGRVIAEIPAEAGWRVAAAGSNAVAIDAVWSTYAVSYKYDDAGRRISMTAPGGARTLYFYDADGRLAHTVNTLGQVASSEYNGFNQIERSVTYDGLVPPATLATLNGGNASALSEVLKSLAPVAIATRTLYNENGQASAIIDPMGALTAYHYDAFGNVSETFAFATPIDPGLPESDVMDGIAKGTFADAAKDRHQRFAYDNAGRLTATFTALQTAQSGLQWSVSTRSYDGAGKLVTTTAFATPITHAAPTGIDANAAMKSASDERVRIVYDVLGRVTATATAQSLVDGRYKWTVQTREYDANGLLAVQRTLSTQLESAEPTTAELNAAAAVRTIADGVTRYAYDEMGRVTHTAVAQGLVDGALRWSVSSVSYDKAGNVTHRTAYAAGLSSATLPPNPTLDDYTAWLKTAKADAIRDRTSRYTYDAGHRLHSTIDAEGGVISQEYDARGNVAQVANGSNVTRNVYDSANRLQYSINAEGAVTEFRYDALGRAAVTLAYANPIETQSLTAETTPQTVGDLLRSKADPAQDHVVYNVHDKDGRVRFSVDALGYVKEMQYDALGRVVATLSYANNVVVSGLSEKTTPDDVTKLLQGKMDGAYDRVARHIYDSDSRLRFTVDGRGYVKEMQYDALGRVNDTLSYNDTADLNPLSLASLSAFGAARADADLTRHESFEYDGQGHLVSTTDGEGHTEYFRYDAAGNKTGFTNKLHKDWTYHYNVAGQLIEEIAPQVSVMNNDRIASTVSLITRLAYDALGNLESRTEGADVPGYERTTRYRYDRVGRQVTTVLPSFSIYNEGETPSTEENAGPAERESGEVSTTVTYDAQGNAISNLDVGDHTSRKVYDKMGRVKYEIDAKGQVTGHKYDAFGQQIELTRYAVASSWDKDVTYSEDDVVARLKNLDHSQDRTIRTIYDRLGHVAKVIEPASYVFDKLKGDNGTAPGYASLARVTENEYNAFGELRLKSVYGADADLVARTAASEERYYYNKRGERIAQYVAEDADRGYLTTTDYNAFGEVGKVTEFSQRVEKSAMTNSSFGSAEANEQDRVTKYDYDDVGQKRSETRYNVDVGVWSDDTQTMTTDHRELVTSFEHDAVGNLLVTTDASGAKTRSYYDATGHVTAVAVQGGNGGKTVLTTFDRDVYGNVVKQTVYAHEVSVDAAGAYSTPETSTDDRTTWTKYNICGYATEQTNAEGNTSFTSYDIFGRVAKQWQNVTSVASAGENFVRTTYTITQYDELGQVSKVITPGPAVKVENHYVLSEIVSSAQNEGHPLRRWASSSAYTGSNKVSLKYPDLGNGFIKVELRYKTQMGWFREDGQYGGMDSYTYTEEGIERVRTFTDMEVGAHMWMSLRGATGVTVSWDDASEPFGGIEAVNGVKVYVLDAAGEWVLKYESQGAELAGAATVTDNMRGNVGTTEHQNIYNAFGELTGKRLNGKRYETSEYDNAGNLWRTNSGDGVDKVMFYNVGGQVTTQLRNADDNVNFGSSGPYKSAQAVAEAFKREDDLAKHIVRNETSYDLMGRAVSQTGAIHNSLASGATSPTAIVSTTISAQVIECTQVSITEADQVTGQWSYVWSGSNKVQVEFNLLESLGNGDLMVEVLYHCNGVGYGPANDGSGDYAPAFFVTADKLTPGSTPGTYSTIVEDVQAPRIDYVNAVRIYKKDLNGQWVLLGETPATTRNGPFLSMGTPEDGLATVRLEYTTASGQVVSMSSADQAQHDAIHRFGERALFDLSALPVGTVSYRLYRSANSDLAETMVESGQLTVATDANGQRTASIETTTVNPGMSTNGRATSRQRLDRWGNVEEVTDPRNPEWSIRYTYNDNNQLTKQERVAPGLLKTLGETYFDAVGREVGTRDGRGYLQRKVYGEDGRLKQEIHADGGLVEYDYNLFGDRTQLRKYTGRDTEGNLQYVATDYAYDHLSRLLKVTNKAVSWRVYEAGTPDNIQVDIDYAANLEVVESYTYDEVGRRTVTTDGLGGKRILRYDHAGNVLAEVDQMGNTTSYAYDAFGNKTAMVVQDDFTRRIQTWDYDDYGHVLAHVDAGNARIAYTYTKLGQLKTQTSDERRNGATTIRGQNIVYTYDGDRVVRINDNTNNKETSYTYDLAGNHLSEITRANGDYVQNSYIQYDQLNRMTRVADGDFNVVIGYDDAGNRETVETTYTHLVNGRTSFKVMNKFDAMNRQILVDGDIVKDQDGNDTAVFGRRSHEIEYDWAGNRTSDKYYAGPTNYEAVTTQRYIYDGAGRLSTVIQDGNSVDERLYDRAGRQIRSGASAGYGLVDPAMLDKWKIPKEYRITQYDAAGRMTHQRVRDLSNATLQDVYFKVSNVNPDWAHQGYSTAGQLRGYYVVAPNGGATTAFKSDYIWFDSAKEVKASASNSGGVSTTTTEYDSNGHLVKVIDAPVSVSGRTREYINDFSGQVLIKVDGGNRLRSLVANGQLLGTNNGYEVDTNFVNPYQSATSSSMTAASSAYTVRTDGETPSSIAQNIWGDSKLWYLIADANALAGNDALAAGKVLRIPPRANTIHNDYQTFKPYNAAEAVGNTTPAMPTPVANSKGGCGVLGKIVVIVVAVLVTYFTYGAAKGVMGAWAAGMLAGAAGSVASQSVGVAIGVQDKISWKSVALSAIASSVSYGMAPAANATSTAFLGMEGMPAVIARAAASNAISQGIGIVTGLQSGFDWRGVAAAGVGAAAGQAMSDSMGLGAGAAAKMGLGERLLKSSLAGFAAGATTAVMRGGRINVTQIATDAFGNALGSSLANSLSRPSLPSSMKSLPQAQQERMLDMAQKAGMNAFSSDEKYQILKEASDLRFNADAQDYGSGEVWRRSSNYLRLLGATPEQIDQVATNYAEAGVLRTGRVDMTYRGPVNSPNDSGTDDIAGPDTRAAAFLGARSVDTGVIGIGNVLHKFGSIVESNIVAKYTLEALDVASGPVIYGVRQIPAIENISQAVTGKIAGFFSEGFEAAGRSEPELEAGAIGGTATLSVGVSGFAGAAKGLLKVASDWKAARTATRAGPASGIHPDYWASRNGEVNIHSSIRALRENGSPEALATAKLVKRGRVQVVFKETDPFGGGAGGRKPWGTNQVEVYLDQVVSPRQAGGTIAHETKHVLQNTTPATHRLDHEVEAYMWQRAADVDFKNATSVESIVKYVETAPLYKGYKWATNSPWKN